jgi:hypothetical protein
VVTGKGIWYSGAMHNDDQSSLESPLHCVTLDMVDAGADILLASPFFDISPWIAEGLSAAVLHAALSIRHNKNDRVDREEP